MKKILLIGLVLLLVASVYAANTLDVQGIYRNETTGEFFNGSFPANYTIYNQTGSVQVYSESVTLFIRNGTFNYIVGETVDINKYIFLTPDLYFQFTLDGTAFANTNYSYAPRSFFALLANDSSYLGGELPSFYARQASLTDINTTINTNLTALQGSIDAMNNQSANTTQDIIDVINTNSPHGNLSNADVRAAMNNSPGVYNLSIDCSLINGSDADFCVDASGGGGGSVVWLDQGEHIQPNSSVAENVLINGTLNITGGTNDILYITDIHGNLMYRIQSNGEVDIIHNVTANGEIASETTVNVNGFGGVNAKVYNYPTGAIVDGQEETVLLFNIDRFLSAGGDVAAIEILFTEGSATGKGIKCGVGVDCLTVLSGTFGDMDTAEVNGTDQLAAFTSTTSDVTIFEQDNNNITLGDAAKFAEIEVILNTTASGAGIDPLFYYSNGTNVWVLFNPTDATEGMKHNGEIDWDISNIPDWSVGTGTEFLIRIQRQKNSLTTVPIENFVQISAVTIYGFDENGDIVANEGNYSLVRVGGVNILTKINDTNATVREFAIERADAANISARTYTDGRIASVENFTAPQLNTTAGDTNFTFTYGATGAVLNFDTPFFTFLRGWMDENSPHTNRTDASIISLINSDSPHTNRTDADIRDTFNNSVGVYNISIDCSRINGSSDNDFCIDGSNSTQDIIDVINTNSPHTNESVSTFLINGTNANFGQINATLNSSFVAGFHIDELNSSHFRLGIP